MEDASRDGKAQSAKAAMARCTLDARPSSTVPAMSASRSAGVARVRAGGSISDMHIYCLNGDGEDEGEGDGDGLYQ